MPTIIRAKAALRKPHNLFIFLATVLGLLFLVIIPPFQVPDEQSHFIRAYAVSEGHVTQVNGPGNKYSGNMVPESVLQFAQLANQDRFASPDHPQAYGYLKSTRLLAHTSFNSKPEVMTDTSNLASYPPLAYVPQAIGILIGRLVTHNLLVMFYAGRLVNLACFLLIGYFAIKYTRLAKYPLAVIGVLPMTMFLASSLSPDALTIASVMAFTALFTHLFVKGEKLPRRYWAALAIATVVMSLAKQAYFILALALLLPLLSRPNRTKDRFVPIAGILTCVALFVIGWSFMNTATTSVLHMQSTTGLAFDPQMQTHALTHQPTHFLEAALNTTFSSNSEGILRSFFGEFGWLNVAYPLWAIIVLGIALFLSFGIESKKAHVAVPEATLSAIGMAGLLLIGLLMYVAILGALYIYWTPTNYHFINGFQGRYLLPILLFVSPALVGHFKHSIRVVYIMSAIVLCNIVALVICFSTYR